MCPPNLQKRKKVKDLRHSRKCLRKRKPKAEEEMDILMALIDLKVVSRVLRMNELSEAQLHWCEEKMSKVRIMGGKLQRDYSTPLFFPSHWLLALLGDWKWICITHFSKYPKVKEYGKAIQISITNMLGGHGFWSLNPWKGTNMTVLCYWCMLKDQSQRKTTWR